MPEHWKLQTNKMGISTFYRSGWLPGLKLGGLTTQPKKFCSKIKMNYEKSKNVELKKNGPIAMTYLIVKFDIAIGPFYYFLFLELTTQPQHTCSKKKKKRITKNQVC